MAVLAVSLVALVVKYYLFFNTIRTVPLPDKTLASEFPSWKTENWLHSEPLTIADLRGQVLLLFFWTFD